eukprot:Blabericola_migrator_1__3340@NODE_1987_length_3452_cov_148_495421_g1265_i0_p1_GENE_NODE_1987_length_3452_cov_148_495421_g1265_i0NODE_1987_length_3452_cov_148_495421_g1265_i0_p1_ORF_typecomplete_len394_score54_00IPK/PF03770_16/4_3e51WD40_3/PF15911_5/0_33_NODE_1987_length_3452_cov_148_495421_g1265_i020783259
MASLKSLPDSTDEDEELTSPVVERYCNQIGGHCAFLKSPGTTYLYKPLSENELAFYEKLAKATSTGRLKRIETPLRVLKEFVPQFYGTGTISVTASATLEHTTDSKPNGKAKYLILEDLLSGHRKPCIVDIKLGRLQRTLGATPEKQRRQWEKALKTTSNALGFRLCGMQSYNVKSDALIYRDKYWGRKLSRERIESAFEEWFSNGVICHYDLMGVIYTKIVALSRVIRELKHYRFWSCSLLCVYDGDAIDAESKLQSLDLRLIDFANTTVLPDEPSPDKDMLLGLDNLAKILYKLLSRGCARGPGIVNGGLSIRKMENRSGRRHRRQKFLSNTSRMVYHSDTDDTSFMSDEEDVSLKCDDTRKRNWTFHRTTYPARCSTGVSWTSTLINSYP